MSSLVVIRGYFVRNVRLVNYPNIGIRDRAKHEGFFQPVAHRWATKVIVSIVFQVGFVGRQFLV
jgi:hypothetical protein